MTKLSKEQRQVARSARLIAHELAMGLGDCERCQGTGTLHEWRVPGWAHWWRGFSSWCDPGIGGPPSWVCSECTGTGSAAADLEVRLLAGGHFPLSVAVSMADRMIAEELSAEVFLDWCESQGRMPGQPGWPGDLPKRWPGKASAASGWTTARIGREIKARLEAIEPRRSPRGDPWVSLVCHDPRTMVRGQLLDTGMVLSQRAWSKLERPPPRGSSQPQ